MSDLLDIQEKLQDTNAMLAQVERQIAANPNIPSLLVNLRALHNRKRQLESQFDSAAAQVGIDVCRYRLLTEGQPKIAAIAKTMLDYQELISILFDALKNGAKQTAKIGADILAETSLDFAYTFPGSVGFTLTIPNERLLLIESALDECVRIVSRLVKSKVPEDILGYARQFGSAPIRSLFRWADDHVKGFFSADIEWRRGQEIRQKFLVQMVEFEKLQQIISQTSEESTVETTLTGNLVGADFDRQTFHIQPDSGGDIRGIFSQTIIGVPAVELPRRYKFTMRKTTRVRFSTEQEDVNFYLLRLEPI